MKKSMSTATAAGLFSLGAVFTAAVTGSGAVDQVIRADIEIVCHSNKRLVESELRQPDARLEIIRRHKYIPFMGKDVLFSVGMKSLTPRDNIPVGAFGGVSFVNREFYPGAGPLGALTYIPKSHCVGTYFTAGADHDVHAKLAPF